MAGFIQIIEYRTSKPDEVAKLVTDFRDARMAAGDGPAPIRGTACADRDEPGRYFSIIEFNSYEEAMENSQRPDTTELSQKMMELCDGPARYYNLDVVESIEYAG